MKNIDRIYSCSTHELLLNKKQFTCIIHTEKNNTKKCFLTFIFNVKHNDFIINKSASFPYNKRFDLVSDFYAEPFYNDNLPKSSRTEILEYLKENINDYN